MLRYMTAGESHAKAVVAVLEGMISGLKVEASSIDRDLKRRMAGYGRGDRMKIEQDVVDIISGLKGGVTLGSPLTLVIDNKDFSIDTLPALLSPRPGHADLAGALKYDHKDLRNVLERASARETAGRVAVGGVCKQFLLVFGIEIQSHVVSLGSVESRASGLSFSEIRKLAEASPVRCADEAAGRLMCAAIDDARESGDTLGGCFEVIGANCPPGLGSYVQWDRRLDANLARGLMSIQAIKAVSMGMGCDAALKRGSECHDEILYENGKGFSRKTNAAGGIEGGVSNGENIVVRAYMKPIATLKEPLMSVDIKTKSPTKAEVQRSDVCAVPAAGVVGEAAAAFEIARAFLEKFGGDSLGETKRNYEGYLEQVRRF